MKTPFFSAVLIASLTLTACASPPGTGPTPPSYSDQLATIVAATLATFPSKTLEPTPSRRRRLAAPTRCREGSC